MKALHGAVFLFAVCLTGALKLPENVALLGRATQSSVHSGWSVPAGAINAVDGNLDNDCQRGSCIVTQYEMSPWWRVDLHRQYKVLVVAITNSVQSPERINGAEILIGDSLNNNGNDNPRCATVSAIHAGATQSFKCNGMCGRYVNIIIRGRIDHLHPCEVQIFAYPSADDGNISG